MIKDNLKRNRNIKIVHLYYRKRVVKTISEKFDLSISQIYNIIRKSGEITPLHHLAKINQKLKFLLH